MVEGLAEWSSRHKTGEGRYNQEKFKEDLGRMPSWKSPGPDLVQGFWLNNFSSLHRRLRSQLKECLLSVLCLVGWPKEGLL